MVGKTSRKFQTFGRLDYGHFFKMLPLYALYENYSFLVAPTESET